MRAVAEIAPGVHRFEVRTPTLPPATHTNVWLLGEAAVVVVDPASPWDDEQRALDDALDAFGRPVAALFLTHHHVDHVSGATHLARRLGVPIWAHAVTRDLLHPQLPVDRTFADGDTLPGTRLRAIHTPGHAPGHLCLLDPETRDLVAGDMVAGIGFIVIDPDDHGDMTQYLDSLRRLRALEPTLLMPAHGPPQRGADAPGKLDEYVAHRLGREAKVADALARAGRPATRAELLPVVYADVSPALYFVADRSLAAHLTRLVALGRARLDGDRYSVA